MNDLILYTTEDGRSQIKLRALEQTVWLTQLEMAELFDTTKQNISLPLINLMEDGELVAAATVKDSLTVQIEGSREVQRSITLYNLDAILAVDYRVRSPRGVQFRRWASTVLKEYLVKGSVMDDERLKNPDGRPDYFDEMLARIPRHPGLRKTLLPESTRSLCPQQRLRQDRPSHQAVLCHHPEHPALRRNRENCR
jgi:hypothetical protein